MKRTTKPKRSLREKILADIHLTEERRKKEIANRYSKERYNKLKKWIPTMEPNKNKFFCFPKQLLEQGVSLSELAVFPVLCGETNPYGQDPSQLSQANIARKAGISVNTAAAAINSLETRGLVEKELKNDGSRRFYIYHPHYIRQKDMEANEGEYFIFFTSIIESGIWSRLKPRTKTLYLGMRAMAKFDKELYAALEKIEEMDIPFENYLERKWDFCNLSIAEICQWMGISSSNLTPITEELEEHRLILKTVMGYLIYLQPRIKRLVEY